MENFHIFTQYTHYLSVIQNNLSWLNNLFMVSFQLISMSSYAKNKLQMCWVTQHQFQMWKIFTNSPSTLTFCLLQSYMESNSASNWYSFQCNLQCSIQSGVEFYWVTQHLQKQICSTLLCTIYCLNYLAKMLSGPQSYIKSNSASYWYSFQCNLQCRIQTGVEFCWVTQHLQM